MFRHSDPAVGAPASEAGLSDSAINFTRSITATWWYTVAGVLIIHGAVLFIWGQSLNRLGLSAGESAVVFVAGLVWFASTLVLLYDYRDHPGASPATRRRRALVALIVAVVVGAVSGLLTGVWVLAVLPLVQSSMLLRWPAGMRLRVTMVATALLAALSVLDAQLVFGGLDPLTWVLFVFSVLAPPGVVVSLWWWDVLVTLDRARLSEARLAATQERLRVATDVHDLQGHHLQVIALQLELAERLFERDPAASVEQLRAARASVDDARQGTRDLALRFRSASLRDELSNAVDLLRAAGTDAAVEVDGDCDAAPADVLGPVVRETTTNVLRHGGGEWARLSLTREGGSWRYRIANDAGEHPVAHDDGGGAGLEGLQRRAEDAGGTLEVHRDAAEFSVTMIVPAVPS